MRNQTNKNNGNELESNTNNNVMNYLCNSLHKDKCIILIALFMIIYCSMVLLTPNQSSSKTSIKEMEMQHITPPINNSTNYTLHINVAEKMRQQILNKVQTLQEPKDCINAEYFLCNIGRRCGLGCILGSVLQCLAHSHKEEKTMVFAKESRVFSEIAWSKYFLPISTCQTYYDSHKTLIFHTNTTIKFIDIHDDWENHRFWVPKYTKSFLNDNNMVYPTGWFLGILNGYLFREFQPNVEQFIKHKIKYLFSNRNTTNNKSVFDIAVHIRRTDKVAVNEQQLYTIREYVNEMDHLIVMSNSNKNRKNYHGFYGEKYNID
eukprot:416952_1